MDYEDAMDYVMFCSFAAVHPHEAAETNWPLFVRAVREHAGWEIPEDTIKAILQETSEE